MGNGRKFHGYFEKNAGYCFRSLSAFESEERIFPDFKTASIAHIHGKNTWTVYSYFSNRIGKISTGREHLETTTLTSKKKRRKETPTSEKNTTASTDKEEDTTEQGTSTEAIHNENKVMFNENNSDTIFFDIFSNSPCFVAMNYALSSILQLADMHRQTKGKANILLTYMFLL